MAAISENKIVEDSEKIVEDSEKNREKKCENYADFYGCDGNHERQK